MKLKQYQKYKESNVEWLGSIPEEWEVKRFKINFKYKKGKIPADLEETNGKGYLPYLSMEYLRGTSEFPFFSNDLNAVKVKEGQLLLLWDGSNAGEFILGKEGYLSSTMVKLEIEDLNKTYSKYLCFAFEQLLRDLTIGMGIPHVNGDVLGNIIINIPSKNEQKQIADFLDKKTTNINNLLEKDRQLIELLTEKRIAMINHIVTKGLNTKAKFKDSDTEWIGKIPGGWTAKKLKQVTEINISNVDKKSKEGESDVLLCNYTDVYKNEFINSTINFMKATASVEQIRRFTIKKGDVMITKDSEEPTDIAIPALIVEDLNNVICGYHLALIRGNKKILEGSFLLRALQSKKINDQFVIEANGVTRFGISTYPILNSYILVPPKTEQTQIVEYLDKATSKIDEVVKKIKKRLNLLAEYKKSLIHNVVTGKVNVQGGNE